MSVPAASLITVPAAGTTVIVLWNTTVTPNVSGAFTLSLAGRLKIVNATYLSFNGSNQTTYTLDATVYQSETATAALAAALVTSLNTGDSNVATTASSVTNSSTAVVAAACDGIAAGLFVNRCMLLRDTESQSSTSAGISDSWAVQAYPLCCSIQASSARETFTGMKDQPGFSFLGYFPVSSGVRSTDRVCYITGYGLAGLSNKILEVDGPAIDHAGRGAYLAVPLTEVPGNG